MAPQKKDIYDIRYIEEKFESAKCFRERKTYERFFESISNKYDICIFGAGALGISICKWLLDISVIPKYFCDNDTNKVGTKIYGDILCISFDELNRKKENVYVIVAIANKTVRHNDMINAQLIDFPNIMRNPLGISIYWEQDFDMDKAGLFADISRIMEILEDEYSKKLYFQLWTLRMQDKVLDYDSTVLNEYYSESQYIVRELINYEKIHSFLDIGAFTGDSLSDFIALGTDADYYCFEMDDEIYSELKDFIIKKYQQKADRIHLFKYAVSDRSKQVKYAADSVGGSKIDSNAVKIAKAVALDDIHFETKIDFIKMDIEGGEENALLGAKKLINRDHPILAISMYHSNMQFADIPLLIKEINANYKLYIRHHKYTLDDTVCYGIYCEEN